MSDNQICQKFTIDAQRVALVASKMESEETFIRLSETFKALSDPARLKIIYALASAELCVCEITALLNLTQSAVSHQLRILRNMRLVKYRKQGRSIFYSLDDEHIERLFLDGLEHVNEER